MSFKTSIAALAGILFVAAHCNALTYEGVNLAGAEFGTSGNDANNLPIPILPGVYGTTYTYPTQDEVSYYESKGMNTFRLPFLWERLEPDLGTGQFDSAQLGYLTSFVSQTTATGAYVILDPHDFGQYYASDGTPSSIGSAGATDQQFADFWGKLATTFGGNSHVIFGLMNEPAGTPVITTENWFNAAQGAVNAIRAANASNLILAPGNYYTGAWSWDTGDGNGTANALVMGGLNDPGVSGVSGKNLAYEVHQYFDSDYSGTSPDIAHPNVNALFGGFTTWLETTGNKGFLGEFGVSANLNGGAAQQDAVTNTLNYLGAHSDVWEGWTWWAGGPWWGNYEFSLEPTNNFTTDAPQMAFLTPFLAPVPEPSVTALLLICAVAYAAACTARSWTSPISSSSASSATRRKPSVASVSATCKLPS